MIGAEKPAATTAGHIPVMLAEMLNYLQPQTQRTYIDATFGRGGYSKAILDHVDGCRVIALDRDPDAENFGRQLQQDYPQRFHFITSRFSELNRVCDNFNTPKVDGIVFDIGVSSPQIDDQARGFSFKKDGPLDMRMERLGLSAADVVNTYSEQQLADIIYTYGEERASRRIARKIIETRRESAFTTTKQLADIVRSVVRMAADGIDPATRSFQALRLYVNRELDELEQGLATAHDLLNDQGRLVVVSFHSLEDRIVKQFFKNKSTQPAISRYRPVVDEQLATLHVLTKKAIYPSAEEIRRNPRARSARLRAAQKINNNKE